MQLGQNAPKPTAEADARKLINDLKAVLNPNSDLPARLQSSLDRLSTQIETLQYGASLHAGHPGDYEWLNKQPVKLTGRQKAFLLALKSAGPRGMSRDGLLMVMYSGIPDNSWPNSKIFDVFACKIRQKFYAAKLPNPIGTLYGRGFEFKTHPETVAWQDTYETDKPDPGHAQSS